MRVERSRKRRRAGPGDAVQREVGKNSAAGPGEHELRKRAEALQQSGGRLAGACFGPLGLRPGGCLGLGQRRLSARTRSFSLCFWRLGWSVPRCATCNDPQMDKSIINDSRSFLSCCLSLRLTNIFLYFLVDNVLEEVSNDSQGTPPGCSSQLQNSSGR